MDRSAENHATLRARLGEPLAVIPPLAAADALPDLAAAAERLADWP